MDQGNEQADDASFDRGHRIPERRESTGGGDYANRPGRIKGTAMTSDTRASMRLEKCRLYAKSGFCYHRKRGRTMGTTRITLRKHVKK